MNKTLRLTIAFGAPLAFVAALAAIAGCSGTGSSSTTSNGAGSASFGGVVAQATNDFGGNGISDPANYGVRVQWTNGNINPNSIVEWNIYRDGYTPVTGAGTSGTTTFTDGPVLVAPSGTHSLIDDGQTRSVTFKYAATGGTGSGTSSTSSTTVSVGLGTLGTGTFASCPGVAVNQVHNYEVTAVYQQQDTVSGTIGYEETSLGVGAAAGYATPLLAVDPAAATTTVNSGGSSVTAYNATGVALSNVILTWASAGSNADDYVVDFSTSPSFSSKVTVTPAGNLLATRIAIGSANLRSLLGLSGTTAQVIYYRIGCRHGADYPGPYANTEYIANPDKNPWGGSYLYAATTGYFSGT
ncbi:MAG: hypothetical protein P4L33_00075 [Capsulimonadaceae bacterium]|nr:hypothetical protein [Capsulimonadaceae bacterium]